VGLPQQQPHTPTHHHTAILFFSTTHHHHPPTPRIGAREAPFSCQWPIHRPRSARWRRRVGHHHHHHHHTHTQPRDLFPFSPRRNASATVPPPRPAAAYFLLGSWPDDDDDPHHHNYHPEGGPASSSPAHSCPPSPTPDHPVRTFPRLRARGCAHTPPTQLNDAPAPTRRADRPHPLCHTPPGAPRPPATPLSRAPADGRAHRAFLTPTKWAEPHPPCTNKTIRRDPPRDGDGSRVGERGRERDQGAPKHSCP
jgi:hypothetical protein